MDDIKIYHLLSHTTGLAPLNRKEELNKLSNHLNYIASGELEFLGKPGEFFSYCNDSFLLLGIIIERLTGKLYRRHITEIILNRLKMYRSTMSLEEIDKFDNVSVPYHHNKKKELEVQSWPKLGNYEVGGGIRSNVLDLLKYGILYINNGMYDEETFINKETLQKMWQNPFKIHEQNYYGYAFKVIPNYNGKTIVEHGGGQPGVSSNFGFIPDEKLVVAVLCNVSGFDVADIWIKAVNTALDLPFEKRRNHFIKGKITKSLDTYCGTYTSLEGSCIDIKRENNVLILANEEKKDQLKRYNDNLFVTKKDKPIYFYFNEKNAWAVLYGARMLTRTKKGGCDE